MLTDVFAYVILKAMQYKKQFIHDRLLEEGMAEFLEKGFRQGSITAISERAGVPIGNLYRYFDGKNGLLDALVKNTYEEFPKLIDKLSWADKEITMIDIAMLMGHLTQLLLNVFGQYGKTMILLVDKCATTRYEDFLDKIIDQVANIVHAKFYESIKTDLDRLMSKIASRAFVTSIFDVLRMQLDEDKTKEILLRIMNFYFCSLETRL